MSQFPTPLQNKRGYVYFVKPKHRNGPIKIGFAKDPAQRLVALQIGCFHELEIYAAVESDDAASMERRLHRDLRRFRSRGEWFAGAPEVYQRILSIEGVATPLGEYRDGGWTLRDLTTLPYGSHFAA